MHIEIFVLLAKERVRFDEIVLNHNVSLQFCCFRENKGRYYLFAKIWSGFGLQLYDLKFVVLFHSRLPALLKIDGIVLQRCLQERLAGCSLKTTTYKYVQVITIF